MRRISLGAVALWLAMGCTAPLVPVDARSADDAGIDVGVTERDSGIDAASADIDAAPVDAAMPVDAALPPDDATIDTGTDGGPLPGTDAAVDDAGPAPCLSPRVMCGTACVDLATDAANCGSCGYAVVGARTCVGGAPSPGWLPIGTAMAPLGYASRMTWTGRELLYISDPSATSSEVRAYDPTTDAWTNVGAPIGGIASAPEVYLVGMPDRNAALLVQSTGAFLWEHPIAGVPGAWRPVLAPPVSWTGTGREGVVSTYTGRYVFLFDPSGTGTGLRYDMTTATWTAVPSTTLCSYNPWRPDPRGISVTYTNGVVVLLTSADPRTTSPPSMCTNSMQAMALLDPDALTWTNVTLTRPSTIMVVDNDIATVLPIGTSVYLGGGTNFTFCASGGVLDRTPPIVFDPRGGTTTVTYAGVPVSSPFAAFTGRAIVQYGGVQMPASCSAAAAPVSNALALGTFDGASMLWRAGPATTAGLRAVDGDNEAQGLWSGRELLMLNGFDAVRGGARYQPPVGCVCPRDAGTPPAVADGCTGVTTPTARYATCMP